MSSFFDRPVDLQSPAKLNLRIKVTGRRADGYHLLSMLNVPVSLCDEIRVVLHQEQKISVKVDGEQSDQDIPLLNDPATNLATRACVLFFERFKIQCGVSLHIRKRIPRGAGLGGGSSNAATLLRFLVSVFDSEIRERCSVGERDRAVQEIALKLGADVPFSLSGGLARVTGIGEIIEALPSEFVDGEQCLLVLPPEHSATAAVFGSLRDVPAERFSDDLILARAFAGQGIVDLEGVWRTIVSLMENDLESLALASHSISATLLQSLRTIPTVRSGMSGSGSALCALSRERGGVTQQDESAIRAIAEPMGARVMRVTLVPGLSIFPLSCSC